MVAAVSVLVLVVAFGSVVAHIPEAVIGGLLLVIGVELIIGRIPDARLAWRTGLAPRILFVVTLVLTIAVPLQWAILAGTVLSLLAYVGTSAASARLRRIDRADGDWLIRDDIPDTLPGDEPLMIRYTGPNFFAVVTSIVDRLPAADLDHPGVLVLDLGELDRYSSTMLKQLTRYTADLLGTGSGLVLVGVDDDQRAVLHRIGLGSQIGDDNILAPDPHLDRALARSYARGENLLAGLRHPGTGGSA